MRALAKTFNQLKTQHRGALITYIAAGDPTISDTPDIVEALAQGGADIIELGIPFSDPIADGPTIQAATVRALKAGVTPKAILEIAGSMKSTISQPLVIMTYFNPIYKMGVKEFFALAQVNEIAGVIVPDLPIEEAKDLKKEAEKVEIDTIFFITPATSRNRIKQTLKIASGFLYLISRFGVTGVRQTVQTLTLQMIKTVRMEVNGALPLAVGFGISTPDQIQTILEAGADAAIIGSALVKIIEQYQENKSDMLTQLQLFCETLKGAFIDDRKQ
ncbi:MAG: tryptophan synthase subunit alpha [Candidatus Helarchaeota archaeon]